MSLSVPNIFVTRVIAVGAAVFLFSLATVTVADSDLWGHLRFGLDMLATWRLSSDDPYSFTQDVPWINHEWLSELGMALAWSFAGGSGLGLLKGALVMTALALVWRALRQVDFGPRIVIFAAAAAAAMPVARTLRPQLWTLVFLVLLCRVLAERRARWWLPALFAVWANVHGGWIVGFGALTLWTLAETLDLRRLEPQRLAVVLSSLAATLLTPYGWGLWHFLGGTVRMGREITEWQPLWNMKPIDVVPWVLTVAFAAWVVRFSARDLWPRVVVLLMLAYSSARVVRIGPLFAACAAVLLADAARARWPRPAAGPLFERSRHDGLIAAFIGAVTLGAAIWIAAGSLTCIRVETPRAADGFAMRLLRSAEPGRLVTFFDWGQYAIWHLGPRLRVSMDGRRETIYSDARLQEHAAVLHGSPDGLATLARWQPEYVWLPATSGATRDWLIGRGYRLEHSSDRSFIAVRPDMPPLRLPQLEPASALSCFPG